MSEKDYIKEHLRLVTIEVEAKRERLEKYERGEPLLWCAMCGKHGDHTSGNCPEYRELVEHRNKLNEEAK